MPTASARRDTCRTLFNEIRAYCVVNANETRARRYARYFTEGYDAYGVDWRDPRHEAVRAAWRERLRAAGPTAWLDLGDLLVRTGKYEEASFAILTAMSLGDLYTPKAFARIGRWFEGGIRNWGHTDVLCGEVLSRFLLDRVVEPEALAPWRDSAHKYQRRAVPVTLIQLLDAPGGVPGLLAFVEPLMRDPEKVVQQGLGWFLREAWKRRPKPVEAFLLRHKETAPRVIIQYATEKMDRAGKERFRRTGSAKDRAVRSRRST